MNVIELVTKYLPVLDEQYRVESKSAILDIAPEFIQQTKDAKKVKIAKISTDGLANYDRAGGFVAGYADLTWEEHEFKIDRGRAIQIDDMDNEETFGLAFGRLTGTFQKDKVIPEIDAYRFATYYGKAEFKKEVTLTDGKILSVIDDIDQEMDESEVDESDRYLFCNPAVYKLIMNDPSIQHMLSVNDGLSKMVNKKIMNYNNHPIIKVPSTRFYTAIDLLDGKTVGQEAGGYKPASGAKTIGLLMIQKWAVMQLSKRRIARIWAPTKEQAAGTDGVNPNADAWKFDFRIYHDAWVLDEKVAGIAAVTIAAATAAVTSVTITSNTEGVSIDSSNASVSIASTPTANLDTVIVKTGAASDEVRWTTSDRTIATISDSGNVVFKKAGSVTITATSVYTPSVKGTVTFTVSA